MNKIKRRGNKPQRPEESLHRAVAEFLDLALPKDAVWLHVPNGGWRSPAEAGIFKALGVKPGFPDILILHNQRAYCIELKAEKGDLTNSQRDMHARLQSARIPVCTCRSIKEVQNALYEFGLPIRGVNVTGAAA